MWPFKPKPAFRATETAKTALGLLPAPIADAIQTEMEIIAKTELDPATSIPAEPEPVGISVISAPEKPATHEPQHHLNTAAQMVQLLEAKLNGFFVELDSVEQHKARVEKDIANTKKSITFYLAAPSILDDKPADAKPGLVLRQPSRKKPNLTVAD